MEATAVAMAVGMVAAITGEDEKVTVKRSPPNQEAILNADSFDLASHGIPVGEQTIIGGWHEKAHIGTYRPDKFPVLNKCAIVSSPGHFLSDKGGKR